MSTRRLEWITPDWPAPPSVRSVTTTRSGGGSGVPYASLNLGAGTGDAPGAVADNRARMLAALGIEHDPCWLRQVHGAEVVSAAQFDRPPPADACVGSPGSPPCVVLTADCLPVVLCDTSGTRVGIAHAGWRGLAAGVIASCVAAMQRPQRPQRELLAWLGPAIGPESYEVGPEVRESILAAEPGARSAFAPCAPGAGRWLANLCEVAVRQLESLGIHRIYGGGFCTYRDRERFFSYRRDGTTGRFATLIWIQNTSRQPTDGGS